MYKTVAFREGECKAVEDQAKHNAPDVDRHIKRWAKDFDQFQAGYLSAYGLWP